MRIAFRFRYIHDNALFVRLLNRIAELSPVALTLHQVDRDHLMVASGEQDELETLAEIVSRLIPRSLFLSEYSIEEMETIEGSKLPDKPEASYAVPYCTECQTQIMETLDPFVECSVCGFKDQNLSLDELIAFTGIKQKNSGSFFEALAAELKSQGTLTLPTCNGLRRFSLLTSRGEGKGGVLVCDPSELSNAFVITQDELDTLMMIEKPSLRLRPKLRFRAESALENPFYPVFFADDKITLALSIALSRQGVFALYCDEPPSLRAASALGEHVIIRSGRDMLPWKNPMALKQAACCTFEGFSAYGEGRGIVLDSGLEPSQPCVRFVCKGDASAKGILFEPAHAALRSVVLEHGLQGRSLCGIYLSRRHASQIFSFSPKIGYTPLAAFTSEFLDTPASMLEAISQMDEKGMRLVENYKQHYPELCGQIENARFDADAEASALTRLWAMAALFIGLSQGGDLQRACEELEAAAIEFNGKSGPRIDYKVKKGESGFQLDARLAIRSAMSFKLAGVDNYLLSFGFIDSLADFIAEQAELADANIAIEGVSISGDLFENRQLLMRGYNGLSPNYTIYRNRRLAMDGAALAAGAITLGSE